MHFQSGIGQIPMIFDLSGSGPSSSWTRTYYWACTATPPDVFSDVVRVLEHLRDQLWIPHQVGLEFHRNREDRLPEQRLVLQRLTRDLDDLIASAERLNIPDYHPVLDLRETDTRRAGIRTAIERVADFVREAADATPATDPTGTGAEDPVLAAVTQLYGGRVGLPMSASESSAAESEALERYGDPCPPDTKMRKEAPRKYNDYFIWQQLLAHAGRSEPRRPCIFVTNDRKEDWWRRRRESLLVPGLN